MGGGGGKSESKSVTTYQPAISYMPQNMQSQANQALSGYFNMPTSIPINYGGGTFQMGSNFPALGMQAATQLYSPQTAGQQMTQSHQEAPTFCGMGCFIFESAERDEKLRELRKFRDTYFPRGCAVQSGYSKMSRFIIPLMRKSRLFKGFMKLIMTTPLITYAKYHYGKNRYGRIFYLVAWMWRNIWWAIGKFVPTREYTWVEYYDFMRSS